MDDDRDMLLTSLTLATGMLFDPWLATTGVRCTSHDGIRIFVGPLPDGRIRVQGTFKDEGANVEIGLMFDADGWTVEQVVEAVSDCLVLVRAMVP